MPSVTYVYDLIALTIRQKFIKNDFGTNCGPSNYYAVTEIIPIIHMNKWFVISFFDDNFDQMSDGDYFNNCSTFEWINMKNLIKYLSLSS